jgi:hypothetical protein
MKRDTFMMLVQAGTPVMVKELGLDTYAVIKTIAYAATLPEKVIAKLPDDGHDVYEFIAYFVDQQQQTPSIHIRPAWLPEDK